MIHGITSWVVWGDECAPVRAVASACGVDPLQIVRWLQDAAPPVGGMLRGRLCRWATDEERAIAEAEPAPWLAPLDSSWQWVQWTTPDGTVSVVPLADAAQRLRRGDRTATTNEVRRALSTGPVVIDGHQLQLQRTKMGRPDRPDRPDRPRAAPPAPAAVIDLDAIRQRHEATSPITPDEEITPMTEEQLISPDTTQVQAPDEDTTTQQATPRPRGGHQHRRPVRVNDRYFWSIGGAARFLGCTQGALSQRLRSHPDGFITDDGVEVVPVDPADVDPKLMGPLPRPLPKRGLRPAQPVLVGDQRFESTAEAARFLGISKATLRNDLRAARGGVITVNDQTVRFANDDPELPQLRNLGLTPLALDRLQAAAADAGMDPDTYLLSILPPPPALAPLMELLTPEQLAALSDTDWEYLRAIATRAA